MNNTETHYFDSNNIMTGERKDRCRRLNFY